MDDYLSKAFPSNDETDGDYLFRNLGTFWYQLFGDAKTLKGYTLGMAEELIQSYYYLIETINSYSVKDIDVYHKEKWYPLIVKKSEFNSVPFVFEPNDAVFGIQPTTDALYAGKLFRFGHPKETSENSLYTYSLPEKTNKIGLIADKIINPAAVLLPGVDYFLKENVIYFNSNIFDNNKILKFKLLKDLGAVATYTNSQGKVLEDEFVVLWLYNTEIDTNLLYNNFGALLDVKFNSSYWYKDLLKNIVNLGVESATIRALRLVLATIMRVPVVLENNELVEEIYSDDIYKYVITNKNVYKIAFNLTLAENVKLGAALNSGDFITDNITLLDSLINPQWWRKQITSSKLAFPSKVFLIDAKKQLLFSNEPELVFYSQGKLTFPILGAEEDVNKFQDNINKPANKIALLKAFNLFENNPKIIEEKETIQDIAYSTEQDIFITTDKNYYRIPRNNNILNSISPGTQLVKGDILMQEYINDRPYPNAPIAINPLDFVFSNIFKNNTVLLKLNFNSPQQLVDFFSTLPVIRAYLPPHVYLLYYVNFQISTEELTTLNNSLNIAAFRDKKFSCDGSLSNLANTSFLKNPRIGGRPELTEEDAMYYKDYVNRLFCVSVGPYRESLPLHDEANLDTINIDNSQKRNNAPGIKSGLLRTEIPLTYSPPGESVTRKPSTKEIQTILLIDF